MQQLQQLKCTVEGALSRLPAGMSVPILSSKKKSINEVVQTVVTPCASPPKVVTAFEYTFWLHDECKTAKLDSDVASQLWLLACALAHIATDNAVPLSAREDTVQHCLRVDRAFAIDACARLRHWADMELDPFVEFVQVVVIDLWLDLWLNDDPEYPGIDMQDPPSEQDEWKDVDATAYEFDMYDKDSDPDHDEYNAELYEVESQVEAVLERLPGPVADRLVKEMTDKEDTEAMVDAADDEDLKTKLERHVPAGSGSDTPEPMCNAWGKSEALRNAGELEVRPKDGTAIHPRAFTMLVNEVIQDFSHDIGMDPRAMRLLHGAAEAHLAELMGRSSDAAGDVRSLKRGRHV